MKQKTFLAEPFSSLWKEGDLFDHAFAIQGKVFRQVKNRTTIRFELNDSAYFIKIHRGTGWREIFKNLLQLKRPVLGAQNEYLAIRHLESLGIDTMTPFAFAQRGNCPASMDSFLITGELAGKISLEDFCRDWKNHPPSPSLKHRIIREIAALLAKMHFSGLNHKDCYICHFLLDEAELREHDGIRLFVLDLHRAELRKKVPYRFWVKDVSGILFSSLDLGLSYRDWLLFRAVYERGGTVPPHFWNDVKAAAVRLYRKEFSRAPGLPEAQA